MTSKCTGLMGSIFGHKWVPLTKKTATRMSISMMGVCAVMSVPSLVAFLDGSKSVCLRCGAVTGEKE